MKSPPLKTKLMALMLGMIVIIAAVLTFQTYRGISALSGELTEQTYTNLHDAAVSYLKTSTHANGEEVSGDINRAYRIPSAIAKIVEGNIKAGDGRMMMREEVSNMPGDALPFFVPDGRPYTTSGSCGSSVVSGVSG